MMGINHTAIGKIVKEFCGKKGLSLNRLALSLGINPVYLNNVLNGKKVSRPLVRRIAEVLNLPDLPQVYEEYLKKQKTRKPIKEACHEEASARNLSSAKAIRRKKPRGR